MISQLQIDDFVDAWKAGDQNALNAILRAVLDEDLDDFLTSTSARTGMVERAVPTTETVQNHLNRAGMSPEDAELMSILATGSFTDWVRAQLARRATSPATLAEQLQDEDHGLDDVELGMVVGWLDELGTGNYGAAELSDQAVTLISRALDASPRTINSLVDRDRD